LSIKQQRFKISPTSRGAIFRLKRWFYLSFYTKAPNEVKEKNREEWLKLSRRLIEEISARNASDKPARITLEYQVGPNGEFIPVSATVELMEIKPYDVVKIHMREEVEEEEKEKEKEKLKAQIAELLKKAQELGLSPENFIK